MAVYKGFKFTKKGKEYLSELVASDKNLKFNNIITSSDVVQDTAIKDLTSIINPKQTIKVSKVSKDVTNPSPVSDKSSVILTTVITNRDVSASYAINTIGLTAINDKGQEILLGVVLAKSPDIMPSTVEASTYSMIVRIRLLINDQLNVTENVDYNSMVPQSEFLDFKSMIESTYVPQSQKATETQDGIAQLYDLESANTDGENTYDIISKNNGLDADNVTEVIKKSEYDSRVRNGEQFIGNIQYVDQNGNQLEGSELENATNNPNSYVKVIKRSDKTRWSKLMDKLDHTKIVTVRGLIKLLSKIIKPAGEDEYGLINYKTIKQVSPKPDLSPYLKYDQTLVYKGNNLGTVDFIIRSNKNMTFTAHEIAMFKEGNSNGYWGSFHVNGGRAYYRVPGRNNGNWCEIMDNHDMAARDSNIQHAHNRITDTWNKAFDAWNKANDAQVNRIVETRLVGWVRDGINSKNERIGYVVVNVSRDWGSNLDGVRVDSRVLQNLKNGSWYNIPVG